MSINDFEGNWTIRSSRSNILKDAGLLQIIGTSQTKADISITNPGDNQETLGQASLSDDRLVISPLQVAGNSFHFEVVRAQSVRSAAKILYGVLFSLDDPLPAADDGATGVWGADEEAPFPASEEG